jgi:hypothetical protein
VSGVAACSGGNEPKTSALGRFLVRLNMIIQEYFNLRIHCLFKAEAKTVSLAPGAGLGYPLTKGE